MLQEPCRALSVTNCWTIALKALICIQRFLVEGPVNYETFQKCTLFDMAWAGRSFPFWPTRKHHAKPRRKCLRCVGRCWPATRQMPGVELWGVAQSFFSFSGFFFCNIYIFEIFAKALSYNILPLSISFPFLDHGNPSMVVPEWVRMVFLGFCRRICSRSQVFFLEGFGARNASLFVKNPHSEQIPAQQKTTPAT